MESDGRQPGHLVTHPALLFGSRVAQVSLSLPLRLHLLLVSMGL